MYRNLNDGQPTRRCSGSVIDLVLVNGDIVPKTLTYESVRSDHTEVLLCVDINHDEEESEPFEKRCLHKVNWGEWKTTTNTKYEQWINGNKQTLD